MLIRAMSAEGGGVEVVTGAVSHNENSNAQFGRVGLADCISRDVLGVISQHMKKQTSFEV